jgi:hypothetical protein
MGIVETDHSRQLIQVISNIFLYGNCISEEVRRNMEGEIAEMWNEPRALIWIQKKPYLVEFKVKVFLYPNLLTHDVLSNTNPRNNYFRIEEFAHGNISFVDGLGCNTGYFLIENLYPGSTTAAHEYGHTIGLGHPEDMDIRGKGAPGIMYPRGTLVNAEYQYDPSVTAGVKGGTLFPIHRKVRQHDIDDLGLLKIINTKDKIIGKFSSVFHEAHHRAV